MLTITFVNETGDTDVADYTVRVFVNGKCIQQERVTSHVRSDGWRALVRRLGRNADTFPTRDDHAPDKTITDY
jgi:hypothetical protein